MDNNVDMNKNILTMEEMEELEDMVCLGDGGSMSCCNGRDGGNSSVSGSYK